ncbi:MULTISPECIES: erythromycin esterase family protein [unclassified Brevundimonas]|uniref:erythromycin esterase family protein n=1 Tax=unclassified Brevundimonas TaxID=2622653 RepID=UPI003F8F9E73
MTAPSSLQIEELAALVRRSSLPLPPVAEEDFAAAFDRFGNARVVLLGEATHGTREFYKARAAITRRLIDRHGFRIVAVEGDWPDVAELDRFIRNRGVWGQRDSFPNFPRWMWRNVEFVAFVHALRAWNLERPMADRAELRGLDVYSLSQSRREVLDYLDRVDPQAAGEARLRYGCLSPYLDQPQRYGAAARLGTVDCEDAVVAQLVSLLRHRLDYSRQDGEDYLDAAQNARVVRAAEAYYRAMYRGSVESWNLRDSHMFETLGHLLQARGPGAKIIVWAHNSHLGDASATAMGEAGEYNLGQLCREAFDRDCVSIGFGTDRGQVAAADDWGGPQEFKQIIPARRDSWEHVFQQAGMGRSLTDWRADPGLAEALGGTRLERAIGVIYRPDTERSSHYFDARLSAQFDAYVWFEETEAVTPLAGAPPEGAPDIYPFGL